eukprot:SAG31_NODE_42722_length_270_cov_0.637427_1_plen_89_part_11
MLKGLDAAELLSLPPPDTGYRVVYEAESAETALRRELDGLKLKDLRQRAKAAGMPASELEAAMDSDEPEELFIDFVVQARLQTDNTDAA